jgi:murein DD-endopeptidase MepM/ murein hydrolase activator NlpD
MLGIALSIGASSFGFQGVAQATTPASTQVSVQSSVTAQATLLAPVSTPQVAIVPQVVPQAVERSLVAPTAVTPLPVTAATDAPTTAVIQSGHAVKPGETLWQIAKSYRVEVQSLATANNLPAAAVLKVGQVLQLPTDSGVQPASGTVNLQAMAQAVPTVPALVTEPVMSASEARQNASVADLRVKRDRLKQTLAETSATTVFAEGQAEAAEAAAKPVQGLPVTRLANVPLPAIGGEEPEMVVQRPVELPAKVTQIASRQEVVTANSQPTLPRPASMPKDFNPTPLLAEIHSLRSRYSQKQLTDAKATLVAQVLPTEPRGTRAQSVAVNPDFAERPASNSALSIELRNFVQPQLRPDAAKAKVVPTANPQVVARATLGSEAYAPITPAVRKMVAPNLPAIGKADAYLPGGSTAGMVWPAQGMLSSGFGWRWGRAHKGIDIAAPIGTPIVAAAAGRVSYAGWNDGGYGYVVEVDHEDGRMTRYAHNDRILVKDGQQVNQGQQISEMGTTGRSTGPHLHFEVRQPDGEAVNPIAFLNNQS